MRSVPVLLSVFATSSVEGLRPRVLHSVRARVRCLSVSGPIWGSGNPAEPLVELYTKEGCTLCDDAKAVLESCRDGAPHALTAVDITDADKTEWFDKYKYDIPVLHIDGKYWTKHRVTQTEALKAIEEASAGEFEARRGQPDAARLEK